MVHNLPLYIRRLHGLATDPTRPWLSKIVGEGLSYAEKSVGDVTTLASEWLGTFLRSAWSGGEALIGLLSVAFVTPIVACHLINDWSRVVGALDRYIPPAHRETVRGLAREMDATIGGFVRAQGTLCLVMALFYAVALSLAGC
jgi:predicted PurR-regulated permease PerM